MKAMPNLEFDESALRRNKDKWNKQVLLLSMGIFLCLTTTLTTIIVLNNFVIVYETRHMLLTVTSQQSLPAYQSPYPIPISDTTYLETVTTPSLDNSDSTTEFTQEISTPVETPTPRSSATTYFGTSTEDVNSTTQTTPGLLNPVIILNDIVGGNLAEYLCLKFCTSPSVITSQLNLTLFSNGKDDNFLRLTVSVNTEDPRVAKQKVAYLALNYLYKDHVNQSFVKDEWNLPVPTSCGMEGNKTWSKCKSSY